jgi:hypothetical protein
MGEWQFVMGDWALAYLCFPHVLRISRYWRMRAPYPVFPCPVVPIVCIQQHLRLHLHLLKCRSRETGDGSEDARAN